MRRKIILNIYFFESWLKLFQILNIYQGDADGDLGIQKSACFQWWGADGI